MNKDSYFIFERYNQILFNEASLKPITIPKEDLIGRIVDIHPVISPNPEEEDYMRWSIKLKGQVIGYSETVHLKDCYTDIKHEIINKSIRSPLAGKGQKAPIILLRGTVVDYNFSLEKLKNKITEGFRAVTYNPHKHDEYLYKDCLPDWWYTDERFWDVSRGERASKVPVRQQAMLDRLQQYKDECEVSKKNENGSKSHFKCEESLLRQHNIRGADYMWVKGVYY